MKSAITVPIPAFEIIISGRNLSKIANSSDLAEILRQRLVSSPRLKFVAGKPADGCSAERAAQLLAMQKHLNIEVKGIFVDARDIVEEGAITQDSFRGCPKTWFHGDY